jgi:hypothetical protein
MASTDAYEMLLKMGVPVRITPLNSPESESLFPSPTDETAPSVEVACPSASDGTGKRRRRKQPGFIPSTVDGGDGQREQPKKADNDPGLQRSKKKSNEVEQPKKADNDPGLQRSKKKSKEVEQTKKADNDPGHPRSKKKSNEVEQPSNIQKSSAKKLDLPSSKKSLGDQKKKSLEKSAKDARLLPGEPSDAVKKEEKQSAKPEMPAQPFAPPVNVTVQPDDNPSPFNVNVQYNNNSSFSSVNSHGSLGKHTVLPPPGLALSGPTSPILSPPVGLPPPLGAPTFMPWMPPSISPTGLSSKPFGVEIAMGPFPPMPLQPPSFDAFGLGHMTGQPAPFGRPMFDRLNLSNGHISAPIRTPPIPSSFPIAPSTGLLESSLRDLQLDQPRFAGSQNKSTPRPPDSRRYDFSDRQTRSQPPFFPPTEYLDGAFSDEMLDLLQHSLIPTERETMNLQQTFVHVEKVLHATFPSNAATLHSFGSTSSGMWLKGSADMDLCITLSKEMLQELETEINEVNAKIEEENEHVTEILRQMDKEKKKKEEEACEDSKDEVSFYIFSRSLK